MKKAPSPARKAAEMARAGIVTFGGQIALDGAFGFAVVTGLGDLARRRRARGPTVALILGAALYLAAAEPWMRRWGSTAAERRADLPGDDLVPDPGIQIDHAVTIDTPPERVWPWLAQIGQDRGGFYSYKWLENLAGCRMRNAGRVHPEWQRREVGEEVMLHPLAPGMPVTIFDPPHTVGLAGWGVFTVRPGGPGRTRLLARGRIARGRAALIYRLTLAVPHFVMERRMLLGIKSRAETTG